MIPTQANKLERFKFFREWSGFCSPPGRAACALDNMRSEERAWHDDDVRVRWEYEQENYSDVWGTDDDEKTVEGLEDGSLECLVLILEVRTCEECDTWELHDSLGMIVLRTDETNARERRVHEAEMLSNYYVTGD